MKKFISCLLIFVLLCSFFGCSSNTKPGEPVQIVATTLPVYDFTARLCQGTDLTVGRMVTESISCLHDYTLQVWQMQMIESADCVVISGAGLEDFMADAISSSKCSIDASRSITLLHGGHGHEHDHGEDPHIWLSPVNAAIMAENICSGLSSLYPEQAGIFASNLKVLKNDLDALYNDGMQTLKDLKSRELITFHDGFGYLAHAFDLEILMAMEEESGSEASAADIEKLIELSKSHNLKAVFTERSGSTAAAEIISRETGLPVFSLDMAMAGDSYFDAMRSNINTLKEALG